MMKITPKQLLIEGVGLVAADQLVVLSEFDDLVANVTFRASLQNSDGAELTWAHVMLDASNYATWDASAVGAHRICAQALGLDLIE
jgi:hypothetical protein